MATDVCRRLNKYRCLKEEVDVAFKVYSAKMEKLKELSLDSITVRLGDLIQELSKLSGVEQSNIGVKIDTGISCYGIYSNFEMAWINANGHYDLRSSDEVLNITISVNNGDNELTDFCFTSLVIPFDFESVQADGRTMYEHMDVEQRTDYSKKRKYTLYVVNKKIENILIDVPFEYLVCGDKYDWYPSDLFTNAVISCASKGYNSINGNVNSRKRKR